MSRDCFSAQVPVDVVAPIGQGIDLEMEVFNETGKEYYYSYSARLLLFLNPPSRRDSSSVAALPSDFSFLACLNERAVTICC